MTDLSIFAGFDQRINEAPREKTRNVQFLRFYGYCPCRPEEMIKLNIHKRYSGKNRRP